MLEQRALVFPNRCRKIGRYSKFLENVWAAAPPEGGLQFRKPHSMGHTFATCALEANVEKELPRPPDSRFPAALWNGIASPSPTDWVGLYQPGAVNGEYPQWIYVSCSPAHSPGWWLGWGSTPSAFDPRHDAPRAP
jgi:hypothetical protein